VTSSNYIVLVTTFWPVAPLNEALANGLEARFRSVIDISLVWTVECWRNCCQQLEYIIDV